MAAGKSLYERETALLLKQADDLGDELDRVQLKLAELEMQNKDLTSHCSMLEKDKMDTNKRMKLVLVSVEKKVEELEIQCQAAKKENEAVRQLHRQEIEETEKQIAAFDQDIKAAVKACLDKHLINEKEVPETEKEKIRMIKFEMETSDFSQQKLLQYLQDYNVALQKDVDAQEDRVKNLCTERDDLMMDVEVVKKSEVEATMQEAATIERPDTEEAPKKRLIDVVKSATKEYHKKKEGPPKPRWR